MIVAAMGASRTMRQHHQRIAAAAIVVARSHRDEPGHVCQHRDRGANRRRHRADEDVAVLDVRQFVRDDAFELALGSSRRMPSVAATAACCGFRPVANAFGDMSGMM